MRGRGNVRCPQAGPASCRTPSEGTRSGGSARGGGQLSTGAADAPVTLRLRVPSVWQPLRPAASATPSQRPPGCPAHCPCPRELLLGQRGKQRHLLWAVGGWWLWHPGAFPFLWEYSLPVFLTGRAGWWDPGAGGTPGDGYFTSSSRGRPTLRLPRRGHLHKKLGAKPSSTPSAGTRPGATGWQPHPPQVAFAGAGGEVPGMLRAEGGRGGGIAKRRAPALGWVRVTLAQRGAPLLLCGRAGEGVRRAVSVGRSVLSPSSCPLFLPRRGPRLCTPARHQCLRAALPVLPQAVRPSARPPAGNRGPARRLRCVARRAVPAQDRL